MSANYAASLSLPLLQSCQLLLSNRTVVNSFPFPRPPGLHWPMQAAVPSPSGGPGQPLFAQWTKLGCSLLSEHCLHFSATGSSLPLTTQPGILLVPSLWWGFYPFLWAHLCAFTLHVDLHPAHFSFRHLSSSYVTTCLQPLKCKNEKASQQTWIHVYLPPTKPGIIFSSAWNRKCTEFKYWIHSLGAQRLFCENFICFHVPAWEFGSKIQMK